MEQAGGAPRGPGRAFLMHHLVVPLAVALSLLTVFELTPADLWLADRWYALEGGSWSWKQGFWTYEILHHWGKQLVIALGLAVLALLLLSITRPRWRPYRRTLAYVLCSMTLLPATIAYAKHFSHVPCPWSLARYGGKLPYHHTLAYAFQTSGMGHCYPAGHSSGGFALLALYFATFSFSHGRARWLLPGIVTGALFSLGQEARGAHFLSHDLSSLFICWFGALLLFLLFRPWRTDGGPRPRPQRSP